jgi:hypothetical protein
MMGLMVAPLFDPKPRADLARWHRAAQVEALDKGVIKADITPRID